jgi:hypothetical protein
MRALKRVVVVVSVAALALPVAGLSEGGPGEDYLGPSGIPTIPSANSKALVKASLARDYGTVWGYLHPRLQKAIDVKRWTTCQRRYPVAPANLTIKKINIAGSRKAPVAIPLLGTVSVRVVTLQFQYTSPAAAGLQFAVAYAFWVQSGKKWYAVWLADTYDQYKAGKCSVAPETRALY